MDWWLDIEEPMLRQRRKHLVKRTRRGVKPAKLVRRPQPLRFYESDMPCPYECFWCGQDNSCCRCQTRESSGCGTIGSMNGCVSYTFIEKNGYQMIWPEGQTKPIILDVNAPFPYEQLEKFQLPHKPAFSLSVPFNTDGNYSDACRLSVKDGSSIDDV